VALDEHGFSPPDDATLARQIGQPVNKVRQLLSALIGLGQIIRLEGDLYFTQKTVKTAENFLRQYAAKQPEISVSEFRERLNTTRKYAVPLLAYFDQTGLTERVGDVRKIIT
ncbi:SelB C-terminal domain-containing protein, partial [candidate division KSB1 bacterium]|nr:SelB C-terminal domain-containing protein [candidate division KSB1 bacterium]